MSGRMISKLRLGLFLLVGMGVCMAFAEPPKAAAAGFGYTTANCRRPSYNFNPVVMVRVIDADGNHVAYSRDFTFRVNVNYTVDWKEHSIVRFEDGYAQSFGPGSGNYDLPSQPAGVSIHAQWNGNTANQPTWGGGNLCDRPGTSTEIVLGYAFRDGDGTCLQYGDGVPASEPDVDSGNKVWVGKCDTPLDPWNNGSFTLNCLGSNGTQYRFTIEGIGDYSGGTWTTGNAAQGDWDADNKSILIKPNDTAGGGDLNHDSGNYVFTYQIPSPAKVSPVVTLSPSPVEASNTYTATAKLINSTTATAATASAKWRTWMDNDQTYGNGNDGPAAALKTATNQAVGTYTFANTTGTADGAYRWVCTELYDVTAASPYGADVLAGSPKLCVPIAKAPGFSVENADVRAGGQRSTGAASVCTTTIPPLISEGSFAPIRGHLYASAKTSAVEYAMMTPGRISNVRYSTTTNSVLAFGSTVPAGRYLGNPTAVAQPNKETYCLPNVLSLYGHLATPSTTTPPLNVATSGEYVLDGAGSETLTVCFGGCTLSAGSRMVIHASRPVGAGGVKKVVIAGNVTYSGSPYAATKDIPQFVVIADPGVDLEIAGGVTEVNGIISAGGKVRTCDQREGGAATMLSTDCSAALLARAVIITDDRVYPFRTAGFSSNTDLAFAEVFRISPGLVLADYARAQSQPTITTRHLTELPPRF